MKTIPDIEIYVRYCETDASGHVNNTSYYLYMEEARTKFLQHMSKQVGNQDWKFILASTKCDYLAQAYAHDTLTVTSKITRIGTKSFSMEHEIKNAETGKLIAKGEGVIVHYNFKLQRSEPLTPEMRSILEQYLVAV
ncbi:MULTISPECIES: acyl-CoA thioesterase [Aeribacillus]|uniref:Thioesterase family protein n=1 Tax=Aeribacillus composti TaxID=1868734 RepID=A0ABY9WI38_9BACI|nr:thioesterase family protein [Aeribacillus composti]WNF34746.1 thioesterase family protein [Aeribacillus composti]